MIAAPINIVGHLLVAIQLVLILNLNTSWPPVIKGQSSIGNTTATAADLFFQGDLRVLTRIKIYNLITDSTEAQVDLEESYCSWGEHAGKAKLLILKQEFSSPNYGNILRDYKLPLSYYYDDRTNTLVKFNYLAASQATSCRQTDAFELLNDLFGKLVVKQLHKGHWIKWFDCRPNHVIGMAKLLFRLQAEREKWIRSKDTVNIRVRNQQVDKYVYEQVTTTTTTTTKSGQEPEQQRHLMYIYVPSKDNNDEFSTNNDRLPLRVVFNLTDNHQMFVDYSRPQRLIQADLYSPPGHSAGDSQQVGSINLFTFPLGHECTRDLVKSTTLRELNQFVVNQRVTSFRFSLKKLWFLERARQLISGRFVAYDGLARALRYDDIHPNSGEYSLTIHDLNEQRKFNIRSRDLSSSSPVSLANNNGRTMQQIRVLQLEQQQQQSNAIINNRGVNQCYSTRSFGLQDGSFEPIIPFNRLIVMGTGLVRGVQVQIYEHISQELPAIFFSKLIYTHTATGKTSAAYDPDVKSTISRDNYTINYFITSQTMILMRVDVYKRANLLYQIDVYDFLWQLTGAPNGDKQHELFELRDRCQGITTIDAKGTSETDRSSSLSLLFRFAGSQSNRTNSESISSASSSLSSVHDIEWASRLIGDLPTRNRALIRGLVELSGIISASQIYDIQTRVHQPRDEVKNTTNALELMASLRLIHSRPKLYQPVSIGTGMTLLRRYRQQQFGYPMHPIMDFEECFWQAARIQSGRLNRPLLFSFCLSNCVIDLEPRSLASPDGFDYINGTSSNSTRSMPTSDVFVIDTKTRSFPCEIMALTIGDDYEQVARTKSWPFIYYTLKSKTLVTLMADTLVQTNSGQLQLSKPEPVAFKLIQIELNNRRWWRSRNNPMTRFGTIGMDLEAHETILNGLALTSEVATKLAVGAEDATSCQLACLTDLNCRSYSICLANSRVECLTSQVGFRNSSLLSQIKAKLSELKSGVKRGGPGHGGGSGLYRSFIKLDNVNYLDFDPIDDSNHDARQTITTDIKLKVDSRCRIYNKRALDMFEQLPKTSSEVVNGDLIAVTDEEECAEICLRLNVEFLTRHNSTDDSGISVLSRDPRNWCSTFKYLNIATANFPNEMLKSVGWDKLKEGGLCSIERIPARTIKSTDQQGRSSYKPTTNESTTTKPFKIKMETYEFSSSMLFIPQQGVRLLGNLITGDESREIYTLEMNKQHIEERDNFEMCARLCFSQTIPLEASCKSFDLIKVVRNETSNRTGALDTSSSSTSYCVYNSITLADAEKIDPPLMRQSGGSIKSWHFEPSLNYAPSDNVEYKTNHVRQQHVEPQGVLIIIVLASLITGIVISIIVRPMVIPKLNPLDEARLSISSSPMSGLIAAVQLQDVAQSQLE